MEGINFLGMHGEIFIVIMCLLVGMFVKATPLDNKWIPIICGAFGGALGAFAMACGVTLAVDNYFDAVAVGIVSGLGSVGCHQAVKQLMKADVMDEFNNIEDIDFTETVDKEDN